MTSIKTDNPDKNIRVVAVDLGERSYEVKIGPGLVPQAGPLISDLKPGARCAVVSDDNVAPLHLTALEASLKHADIYTGSIVLPAGESTKSYGQLEHLCESLLHLELERGDIVVALGGGVIGDLAGFAAAIVRRGVTMVQIPTSLLAQVDSSVGGKTGINSPQGKNLIGAFHQPALVLADTDVLTTLPVRELRAGYAEIVKYGLLGDRDFFVWLENNWKSVFGNDPQAMTRAIEKSCQAKAGIVARDELEAGERALLNLGHTFGHALEAWTGYCDRLLHGEGVAIGTVLAFRLSEELGHCPPGTTARVEAHFADVGLPTAIQDIPAVPGGTEADARELVALMAQDKKVVRGEIALILARGIGEAFLAREVSTDQLVDFLDRQLDSG